MLPFKFKNQALDTEQLKSPEKERFNIKNFDSSQYDRIEDMPKEARGYFMQNPQYLGGGFRKNARFYEETNDFLQEDPVFQIEPLTFPEGEEYLKVLNTPISTPMVKTTINIARGFGHQWAFLFDDDLRLSKDYQRNIDAYLGIEEVEVERTLTEALSSYRNKTDNGETLTYNDLQSVCSAFDEVKRRSSSFPQSEHPTIPLCITKKDKKVAASDSSSSGRFWWSTGEDGSYKVSVSKGAGVGPVNKNLENKEMTGRTLFQIKGAHFGEGALVVGEASFENRHVYALMDAMRYAGLIGREPYYQIDYFLARAYIDDINEPKDKTLVKEAIENLLSEYVAYRNKLLSLITPAVQRLPNPDDFLSGYNEDTENYYNVILAHNQKIFEDLHLNKQINNSSV